MPIVFGEPVNSVDDSVRIFQCYGDGVLGPTAPAIGSTILTTVTE